MGFRNFRLNIIIRLVLVMLVASTAVLLASRSQPIRAVYTGVLAVLLLVEFFYYTDRLNRDLNQFFSSILHNDFSPVFRDRTGGRSFRELYKTMDDITLRFRILAKEKEMRGQYLFSLIDQVKVGIISYEPEGNIHLVNASFTEILKLPALRTGSNLKELAPDLFALFESLNTGEKQLIRKRIRNEEKEFSVVSAGFKMDERFFQLVSVQDIREELDQRELEAWQKLIRVLTHEIMNSVSPIASLTGSLSDLVGKSPSVENLNEKLGAGLEAIRERSEGLIKFTEAYQHLARIPVPVVKEIESIAFLKKIGLLFNAQCEAEGIRFRIESGSAPASFHADPELLEQVIINLLKNALEATADAVRPEISMHIESLPDGKTAIIVRDNGRGIPAGLTDRIFVPFFSTKEKGSGIGLSLSRQIVMMHRGTISVRSEEGKGSAFEIQI